MCALFSNFFAVAESFLKWANFIPLQAGTFCLLSFVGELSTFEFLLGQLLNFYWLFGCPFPSPKRIFSFLPFTFEVSFCTVVIYCLILGKDHIFSFQFVLLHFTIASTPYCLPLISQFFRRFFFFVIHFRVFDLMQYNYSLPKTLINTLNITKQYLSSLIRNHKPTIFPLITNMNNC